MVEFIDMGDMHMFYLDGVEICKGDRVLVNGRVQATIIEVFQPGDVAGSDYDLLTGGFLVQFDSGGLQAWPYADEDIEKLPLN